MADNLKPFAKREAAERASSGAGVGGFREALNLSHIVHKYEALSDSTEVTRVRYTEFEEGRIKSARPAAETEPIPDRLYDRATLTGDGEDPEKVGNGPLAASTCRALTHPHPDLFRFAWDPNRYYRSLGIPWPFVNATRLDLRRAFMTLQPHGPEDQWLTHCLKQLINSEIREQYDALPRGERYRNCSFEQDRLKAEVAEKKHQFAKQGQYPSTADILSMDGFEFIPEENDTPEGALDDHRLKRLTHSTVGGPWQYAFYVWRTTRWDVELLAQWQAALISKVAGRVPHLTVGVMGNQPHRFAIGEVDGNLVVYLNRDEPVTDELVATATNQLVLRVSASEKTGSD